MSALNENLICLTRREKRLFTLLKTYFYRLQLEDTTKIYSEVAMA